METHIQKWGNSLAVRIPVEILKKLKLEQGSAVDLFIHEGHIAISPQATVTLDNLLEQITSDNLHEICLDDDSQGKEAW